MIVHRVMSLLIRLYISQQEKSCERSFWRSRRVVKRTIFELFVTESIRCQTTARRNFGIV